MRTPQIRSTQLSEISSPRLEKLLSYLNIARGKVRDLDNQIRRVERARDRYEDQTPDPDEQDAHQETLMRLEVLIHEIEEQRAWWANRSSLPEVEGKWAKLVDAFGQVRGSQMIWDITRKQLGGQYRTIASASLERHPVRCGFHSLCEIAPSQRALHIENANGPDIYIFPSLVVFQKREKYGIVDIQDINHSGLQTRFVEEEGVPSDSHVVGSTWKYTNNDGSPDRRFSNNYQIPIAQYGEISFQTSHGLKEVYQVSNPEAAIAFRDAFYLHQAHVDTFPIERYEDAADPPDEIRQRAAEIEEEIDDLALPESSSTTRWVFSVLVAVILIGALALIFYQQSTSNEKTADSHPPPERMEMSVAETIGQGPFTLTVIASSDKLSPIRVTVDEGVRRPYWIELEDAIQFRWANEITLEGDLPCTIILLNSHVLARGDTLSQQYTVTDSIATSFTKRINPMDLNS